MDLFFDPCVPTRACLAADCPIPEQDREECERGQQGWLELSNIFCTETT